MSDSVWPHPWDSPGKNTGVGCHFLLQCMEVKSESEVDQPCLTFRDPTDCSLPGSSIHGIFQARVLEWGSIAFSDIYLRIMQILFLDTYPQGNLYRSHEDTVYGFCGSEVDECQVSITKRKIKCNTNMTEYHPANRINQLAIYTYSNMNSP